MYAEKWKIKKYIKPVEPVVEPEPTIKPVRLKNRFLKHCNKEQSFKKLGSFHVEKRN